MRKILSLVLAALMAFGSTSFAAVNYDSVGNELKDLGVIQGKDDGTLATFDKLTKEEAIVIISRMLGKEAEAKATAAQSGFSDVPENSFYAPYIAWAKLNNITNGKSESEFGFKETVTTKVVATYMLRALGYVEEAKWTETNDVMAQAEKLGLLKEVSAKADEEIIRGEVFQMMHNTLYTEVKGEKQTLAKKLNLVKDATSETLEVVDVRSTNLKEIEVEFNQPVNKDTLKSAFTVSSLQLEEPELKEDGKTVVLTVKTNMTNGKEYKLSISRVKTSSNIMMDKVVKTFTVKDVDAPEVVGDVKVTGPREFSIEFSEPVKSVDKAKIKVKKDNKTNVSVSDAKLDDDNNRVLKITLSSAMTDSSEYTVSLDAAVEDFAGYKNRFSELSFAYVATKDAPVAEISEANQKYVVVKFDRPVKGLTKDHFYHTYSSYKAKGVFASKEDMDKNTSLAETKSVDTVYVLFATGTESGNYPLQEGDVRVNVLGSVSGKKIVDNWNNQLKDQELTVSVTADKESPVVEKVEVKSNKTVEVTFSKDIKSFTNTNVEFLTSDGKKMTDVSVTVKADSKKVYTLELSKSLEGKTVVLNIKDVRDNTLRENKLDGIYSETISFDDKEFAGPEKAYMVTEDGRVKIYVAFSEAVDSSTAENIKNYKFSVDERGTQFAIDADATISPDSNSVVVIDLGVADDDNSVYKLKKMDTVKFVHVSNEITDLAGNKMIAFSKPLDLNVKVDEVKITKAEAVSKTEIKVTFDQQLKAGDIKTANIVVTNSDVVSADFVEGENNKVVKLTLSDDRKLNAAPTAVTVEFKTDSGFTSVLGGKIEIKAVAVTDKIAPSVAKIVDDYKDVQITELKVNADKTVTGKIEITTDEDLDTKGAYSINSVKLNGIVAKVTSVSVVGEKLEVEFTLNEGNGRTLVDSLQAKSGLSTGDVVVKVKTGETEDAVTNIHYFKTDLTVSIVDPLRDNAGNAVKDETTPDVYIEKAKLPTKTFDDSVKEEVAAGVEKAYTDATQTFGGYKDVADTAATDLESFAALSVGDVLIKTEDKERIAAMPVNSDDEKKAYTDAVNALATVTLDEAKVKTLNYNDLTVAEWVTNASTAKAKDTEVVANGDFFVATEGEKTIALTGTIADLKLNIDKVKKAAPALAASIAFEAQGTQNHTKVDAATNSAVTASHKYLVIDTINAKDYVFTLEDDAVAINGDLSTDKDDIDCGASTGKSIVIVEITEGKVVGYTIVDLNGKISE